MFLAHKCVHHLTVSKQNKYNCFGYTDVKTWPQWSLRFPRHSVSLLNSCFKISVIFKFLEASPSIVQILVISVFWWESRLCPIGSTSGAMGRFAYHVVTYLQNLWNLCEITYNLSYTTIFLFSGTRIFLKIFFFIFSLVLRILISSPILPYNLT